MVATAALFNSTTLGPTTEPVPTGSRCIVAKAICDPGKHPICICESDISFDLANCMLLTREENGAAGKGDVLPEVWFDGKDEQYLAKHLIPADPSLWKIDRFEDFLDERKRLIRKRFESLLVSTTTATAL